MQADQNSAVPLMFRSPDDIRRRLEPRGLDAQTVESFLRLHKYAVDHHLGLSRLAARLHIVQGILSPAFNATYTGDYAAIAERIDSFFWREEQKAKYGGLRQYVQTQLADALYVYFEKTRITRRIQMITSPEQIGKTRVAMEYTEQNNSGRTVYVKVPGGNKTGLGTFIRALAEALNLPASLKLSELRFRIKEALESCDLIIVDEFHLIWTWAAPAIRDFFDYLRTDIHSDGKRGVVAISTNSDPVSNIMRFRKDTGYNIGQLLGRMRTETVEIDPEEDITEKDVLMLTRRYYEPGKIALRKLHSMATQPMMGHFGLLDDVLNESWTLAKARKQQLDDDLVLLVAKRITDKLADRTSDRRAA